MSFGIFKKLRSVFSAPAAAASGPCVSTGPKTWDEERDDFFSAISASDTATLTETVQKYPEAFDWRNERGEKALYIAVIKKKTAVLGHLIDLGADVNQKETCTGLDCAQPILGVAGRSGNKEAAQLLLERGADPRGKAVGWSAEEWTTSNGANYDIADMIKRGDKIRADYLARQPAPPAPAPVPALAPAATTGDDIKVLSPLRLRNSGKLEA